MRANFKKVFYQGIKKSLLIFLFLPVLAFSQSKETGTIEYLKSCNGFNNIKLGEDIGQIPGYKLSFLDGNNKLDADSCMTYAYTDNNVLKADSDLKLDMIGIRTFKNKIVNIYLFFEIKDSYKILRTFLNNYGQFTNLPYEYTDIYDWNTSVVNLSLKYADKKSGTGVAVFTCNSLIAQIDEMKQNQERIYQALASVVSSFSQNTNANFTTSAR